VCDPSKPLPAPAGVAAVFPGGARDRAQIRWLAPPLSSCSLTGYKLTAVDGSGEDAETLSVPASLNKDLSQKFLFELHRQHTSRLHIALLGPGMLTTHPRPHHG
jgi:hypothetical protein